MVVDIREVCAQDKSQWLQLWQGYTSFYGSPQPADVTEYTWQRLLDHGSPVLGRVAVVDDRVAGFAICVLHEGTWVKPRFAIWKTCSSIRSSAAAALPGN